MIIWFANSLWGAAQHWATGKQEREEVLAQPPPAGGCLRTAPQHTCTRPSPTQGCSSICKAPLSTSAVAAATSPPPPAARRGDWAISWSSDTFLHGGCTRPAAPTTSGPHQTPWHCSVREAADASAATCTSPACLRNARQCTGFLSNLPHHSYGESSVRAAGKKICLLIANEQQVSLLAHE